MHNLKIKIDKIISNIDGDNFTADNLERLKQDINLVDILKDEREKYCTLANNTQNTILDAKYHKIISAIDTLIEVL